MVTPRPLQAVLALLWSLLATPAWAQDVALRVETDQLAVGQRLPFAVVVSGAEPRGTPRVIAQDGLETSFVGQSQTMTLINGRMERYVKFQYEVWATDPGPRLLGPAYVQVDGAGPQRTITTNTVELLVRPPEQADASTARLSVQAEFSTAQAWQGQVVLFHQVLRSRESLAQARWLGTPTDGLMAPRDGTPETREYVLQDAQGQVLVNEQWVPLVATEAGSRRWPAPALEAHVVVDDGGPSRLLRFFSRTRREVVAAQPLALDVRPLPPPPTDFSGLVGTFRLSQRIDPRNAHVGDSIPWTIFLDGTGTLEGYALPEVQEVDGLRIYDKALRPRASTRKGEYKAGLTFERTLVPTREGRIQLPTLRVVVFDTDSGSYETLELVGAVIDVARGEGDELQLQSFGPDGSVDVAPPEEDDIRPLRGSGPGLRLPWLAWFPLALALAGAPGLAWLGGGALAAWAASRARRRQVEAARPLTPTEQLARLPDAAPARLDALDAVLRSALAHAVDQPPGQLDRQAALEALPPATAAALDALSQLLDRVRFAGAAAPPDLEARVRALVHELEGT
ncbi:MAG: BatD family protein [Alphaproteobacteria bacterium]|nr:BatD family protein [Alphaproteobacteria bacterium]